ncbi:MAG: DnaK suppressor protein [Parasphingorhabdus sp.]|jgi:DnaK suppressor protein
MQNQNFYTLLTERQRLLKNSEGAVQHDDVTLDQTRLGRLSRMDALQTHEINLDAERRRIQELKLIEVALGKLQEDEYGYCEECDNAIPIGRLEIDPSCRFCVQCASEMELKNK